MPEPITGPLNTLTVTSKQGDTYSLSPVDSGARQEIDDAENLQFDERYFTAEEDTTNHEVNIGLAGVPFSVASPLKIVQDTENGIVIGSDTPTDLAPEYDPAATYAKGEPCTYDGLLYACKDGIAVAEQWNAAHWEKTDVATLLAAKASTATTLAGYGITDASITESQGTKTVTLGNESLVPMLSASAPLQASGNSLSLTHTTATFTTYVDSGDGTPLAVDENTPLLADEVELVDAIGGKELLARRVYQDQDGQNIKDTYATKSELQAALGDIETALDAIINGTSAGA